MITLLIVLLATPAQFKTAGDAAFLALRDYQLVVLQHEQRHDAWPADAGEVDAKLAVAYECVLDSLKLGADLDGHGISAPALSLLRSERQTLGALGALTVGAPADAQVAWKKAQAAFEKLFALFPDAEGEFYRHPQAVKR